jgi:hypothetical protein
MKVDHKARVDLDAGNVEYTTEAFDAAYAFIMERGVRFSTNNEFRQKYVRREREREGEREREREGGRDVRRRHVETMDYTDVQPHSFTDTQTHRHTVTET